jgi:CRP-like cAMP-binding protein
MSAKYTRNIRKCLSEFPLFAHLAPEHLDELAKTSRIAAVQKDQALYRAGDPAGEMHILLSGQVTLSVSCNRGHEKIIEVLHPGQSFGEAELFGAHPYPAAAVATLPSQVLCIRRDALCSAMEQDPRVALRAMEELARRQVDMEAELATRRFCSGGQRLLDFMLQLAGPKRDLVGETTVTLGISKKVLASRFDMQPETLSRTLRDLSAAGLIVVDRSKIKLRNTMIARYLDDESLPQPVHFPTIRRVPRMGGNGCKRRGSVSAARSEAGDLRSSCDSINMAGRQRMLSQRMAKSWLMLERGLLPNQSRLILKQSIAMFDSQLRELDIRADAAGSAVDCAQLAGLWPRYRSLLDASPGRKAARELFVVNEEVLAAAQELTQSFARIDGTPRGELVNLAGRERMLSQRTAKFFMFGHMGIRTSKCRAELDDANHEFAGNLARLAAAAQDQAGIHGELEAVSRHWEALQSTIAIRNGEDFAPNARKVFTTSEHLLRHMNTAVDLYARLPDLISPAGACPTGRKEFSQ